MKSCIEEIAGGLLLTVHVKPHSKRNSLRFPAITDPIEVSLTEVARDGRANRQLFEFLSKTLCVKKNSMQLIAGARSNIKKIFVKDLNRQQVLQLVSDA